MKSNLKKISGVYHDADEYAKNVHQGKLEHYSLEPGKFYGELTEIISNKMIIGIHKMNLAVLQQGTGLRGVTTFLIPGNIEQDFTWRHHRISGIRIGLLKSRMAHFAVMPHNFFGTPISIYNNYFNELIFKLNYDKNFFKVIQEKEVLEINKDDAIEIQKMVIELCNSSKIDQDVLNIELPVMILKALFRMLNDLPQQISNSREAWVSMALEYINKNLDKSLKTSDICDHVKTNERNLRYGFKELVGISPKKFIKNLKLNKARKDIKLANKNAEINIIANRWGFGHSGQFAADYKRLFGELPSESFGR
ncbi:MAG: hypothetical protein DRI54_05245 [Bacteroidetes bacterium]|nr:MAG: hypothetical protein DRI54_05245 [Bacteroidota bacterium]